jgi:hypothetical protein
MKMQRIHSRGIQALEESATRKGLRFCFWFLLTTFLFIIPDHHGNQQLPSLVHPAHHSIS